jgi:HAD superfamily hydrolase (TIGR01509 family)
MIAVFFDIGETLVDRQANWNPGAQSCLSFLRNAGEPLGLISNTGNLSREQLQQHLPAEFDFGLFEPDLVILSSELGKEKPDPAIFIHAIAQSGQSPANCIFVGEKLTEVWAAQSVGMRTVRACRFPEDFTTLVELVGEQ